MTPLFIYITDSKSKQDFMTVDDAVMMQLRYKNEAPPDIANNAIRKILTLETEAYFCLQDLSLKSVGLQIQDSFNGTSKYKEAGSIRYAVIPTNASEIHAIMYFGVVDGCIVIADRALPGLEQVGMYVEHKLKLMPDYQGAYGERGVSVNN